MQFYRVDELVHAYTDDLSPKGAFVRTDAWLPINGIVDLCVLLSEHDPFVVPARVAYCLPPEQADGLGRRAGIGFEFLPSPHRRLEPLERYFRRMNPTGPALASLRSSRPAKVLVGCESARLRKRLMHALSPGHFELAVVESGAELYTRARRGDWDVLVVDESIGGARWLASSARSLRGRALPVLLISAGQDELARLSAYRAGAADYLQRPFSDEELLLRVTRLSERRLRCPTPDFIGDLSRMPLTSVLTLLEIEQRSGLLLIRGLPDADTVARASERLVRVTICRGAIGGVDGRADAPARARLFDTLAWCRGTFEFHSADVEPAGDRSWSISALLMRNAQLVDERASQPGPGPAGPSRRRRQTPA